MNDEGAKPMQHQPWCLERIIHPFDCICRPFRLAPECHQGCQYGEDVGMPGDTCGSKCMYLAPPALQETQKP